MCTGKYQPTVQIPSSLCEEQEKGKSNRETEHVLGGDIKVIGLDQDLDQFLFLLTSGGPD